ncbi:MAG TPA: amidohydrolase family protein [Gaiellales bacterium]
MTSTTVVVGGTVVRPEGSAPADVLIRDGVIAAVGRVDRAGAEVVDASGCLVLPGGVDVHTHIFGAVATDTRSALCGGTTTALAFVDAEPGERPVEAARRTIADELPAALIDVALHAVIWEPQAYRPGDMAAVAELGVGSVKLWLAYVELGIMADDDVAFAVMQEAAALGMVVLAHCENGRVVDVLTRQLVAAGELGLESLPVSRPIALEAECVHRFLVMAEVAGATPYVVHVTGRRPLEAIAAARERGQTVHAEACSHHLLFDESHHRGADAVRYVMTPPLRSLADQAALRAGLAGGALDTYASDHCHLRLDRDKLPLLGDFSQVPTGLPGIGARLPLGLGLAAAGDGPAVERLVAAACAAPARIFGLSPQKGTLAPGSDADVAVWDPSVPTRVTLDALGDGLDWTPYEGIELPGRMRHVLARGDRVVEDGRFIGGEHRGAYLAVRR